MFLCAHQILTIRKPENAARRMLASRSLHSKVCPKEWLGESGHPQDISKSAIAYAKDTLNIVEKGLLCRGAHRLLGDMLMKIVVLVE